MCYLWGFPPEGGMTVFAARSMLLGQLMDALRLERVRNQINLVCLHWCHLKSNRLYKLLIPTKNISQWSVIYKSTSNGILALITANVKLNTLETTYPPPPPSTTQWFKNQTITYLVCLHWSQVLMMWYYCNCQPAHVTSLMAMDFPYYCLNFDTCVWQIESEGTLTNIFG